MATFMDRRMATGQKARDKALSKGGRILTPTWVKNDDPIEVECGEGHQWSSTAYRVNDGDWCPSCFHHHLGAKKRERSLERFRDYVAERGGKIFDARPSPDGQGREVECEEGHRFIVDPVDAVYNRIWCPECREAEQEARQHHKRLMKREESKRAQVDREARSDALLCDAAAKSGLQVLEVLEVLPGAKHPMVRLLCMQHHGEILLRDDQVRAGHRCKVCRQREASQTGRDRRLEAARLEAIRRGGLLISETYTAAGQSLEWQCREGHRWQASAASVLRRQGTWCPTCARISASALRSPKVAATRRGRLLVLARLIAEGRGGRCLDEVYRSSAEGLHFQCSRGHGFRLTFRKLRYQWCDQCSRTRHSRGEMVTRGILEQLLGMPLPPGRPAWLVSDKGRGMSLDGYSEDGRIAFEYQGEGVHSGGRTTGRYSDQAKLARTQELDRQKVTLCQEAGIRLLVIDGFGARTSRCAMLERILASLDVAGVPYNRDRAVDWAKIVLVHDSLRGRLETKLAESGLRLVSALVANVFSPIQVECGHHGIIWETTATAVIHRNRLCPECTGRSKRRGQEREQVQIEN